MGKKPLVSVIIPVYNAEKYLRECLDSVVNQTLKNIEIICVNDGSTDGSLAILREYEANDPRVKVLTQPNMNAGAARNNGFAHANGKYTIFLDADDLFEEMLLETSYFAAERDHCDICAFNFTRFSEPGKQEKRIGIHTERLPEGIKVFSYRDCPDLIMTVVNPTPWNKLYRSDFIRENKLHFEEITSTNDITFAAVSVAAANRISVLHDYLVHYRVSHSGTISSQKSKRLNNVMTAVKSGVVQVSHFQHYKEIKNSAMAFAVSNIVFALKKYVQSIHDSHAAIFYANVHEFFNSDYFSGCTVESLHSQVLFDYFSFIRDTSYSQLSSQPIDKITDELVKAYSNEHISNAEGKSGNKNSTITMRKSLKKDRLIVSLTSYPPRIETVHKTIETLLLQTLKPDTIILWLSEDEFPNKEKDLPKELISLKDRGLEIGWCENLKSYKKLIPTLKLYSDAVIVTADDDLYYHPQWLERLYKSYLDNPDCIHCHRITKFYLSESGDFCAIPGGYEFWNYPSFLNKLGGGSGALYPPHCFPSDVLDQEKFLTLAPTSDDIWFWLMGALAGYKVRVVPNNIAELNYVEGTQDCGLWHINDHGEKLFWKHFNNILKLYPVVEIRLRAAYQEAILLDNALKMEKQYPQLEAKLIEIENKCSQLTERLAFSEQVITDMHSSVSFRTGRAITWFPRKIRGGFRCLKEHGMAYTWGRFLVHLRLRKDGEEVKAPLLKRFVTCYRDNGYHYTIRRLLIHLHLVKEEPNYLLTESASTPVRRDYAFYSSLDPSEYPKELVLWYKRATGETLDLEHPRTFNEKIQWMKLYDSTPIKTKLADKYLVREWVKEKIGEEYLIPLLGVWDSFDEIDFDKLPDQFALKANHGSGWNIIVKDKATFDREAAKKKFDEWMNSNFAFKAGLELHYMNIPPKIIAEEYIENVEGLKDYRFYCFNGKPTQVWVDIYSGTPNHLRSVYDMEWNLLPLKCTWPDGGELLREKPKTFEKMKKFARLLCQGFAFVRVDFFDVDGKLYMGEMTFTPMTGTGKFEPAQWNVELGNVLILPPKSPIPKRLR